MVNMSLVRFVRVISIVNIEINISNSTNNTITIHKLPAKMGVCKLVYLLFCNLEWFVYVQKFVCAKFMGNKNTTDLSWLVVSTHFKNISQIGNLPQVGVKMKKIFELPPPSKVCRILIVLKYRGSVSD